jgi:acyl transferase domain-containing protein
MISRTTGQVMSPGLVPDASYWSEPPTASPASEDALRSCGCDFVVRIGADVEWAPLIATVTSLHLAGVPIDWKGFDRDYPRHLVGLPTYPFERKRCWLEPFEIRAWAGPMRKVGA